jgi:hypothetical protein
LSYGAALATLTRGMTARFAPFPQLLQTFLPRWQQKYSRIQNDVLACIHHHL